MGSAIILGAGSDITYSFVTASSYASLPSVAAEDTIGLITSLSVSRVDFCNDLPTSGVSAGEVRIKVGSVAQNYINILADPLVRVPPISAYRYSGASWVMIEAYVRRSAAWSIIRAEFYKDGTAGMIGSLVGAKVGAANYTIGASSIVLDLTGGGTGGYACVYGDTAIDVSNYSTIKVSYTRVRTGSSGSHKVRIYLNPTVLTGSGSDFSEGAGGADLPVGTNTISFNVSAIAGMQIIHLAVGKSSYYDTDVVTITKVYGE